MLNGNSVPSDHDYKYVIFCYYKGGYTKKHFYNINQRKKSTEKVIFQINKYHISSSTIYFHH